MELFNTDHPLHWRLTRAVDFQGTSKKGSTPVDHTGTHAQHSVCLRTCTAAFQSSVSSISRGKLEPLHPLRMRYSVVISNDTASSC